MADTAAGCTPCSAARSGAVHCTRPRTACYVVGTGIGFGMVHSTTTGSPTVLAKSDIDARSIRWVFARTRLRGTVETHKVHSQSLVHWWENGYGSTHDGNGRGPGRAISGRTRGHPGGCYRRKATASEERSPHLRRGRGIAASERRHNRRSAFRRPITSDTSAFRAQRSGALSSGRPSTRLDRTSSAGSTRLIPSSIVS